MKLLLGILNGIALSYVTHKLMEWAKKRWGLEDPPKWALSILPVAVMVYAVYRDGMEAIASLGYMLLTLVIFGAMFLIPFGSRNEVNSHERMDRRS